MHKAIRFTSLMLLSVPGGTNALLANEINSNSPSG
jgi:hypothetical protein